MKLQLDADGKAGMKAQAQDEWSLHGPKAREGGEGRVLVESRPGVVCAFRSYSVAEADRYNRCMNLVRSLSRQGNVIVEVLEGSPAEKAGLLAGDAVEVRTPHEFYTSLHAPMPISTCGHK